ncbi:MAG: CoA pyrophosphatase [Thermodesulfobacteriota bacterium]
MSLSLPFIKKQISLDVPPEAPPAGLKPAGVLIPLFAVGADPHLLFTQRTMSVKDHQGQISFPGGVRDRRDPDLQATALRESQEEIGLNPEAVEIVGSLNPIATITGYWITAFVAQIPYPYEFAVNTKEVKRLLILPVEGFCPPERWSTGNYTYQGKTIQVCYWRRQKTVIWGATARLLLDLLSRLGRNPFVNEKGDCMT